MKIVGLTGGIGSGKSSVLNQFKNLGINTSVSYTHLRANETGRNGVFPVVR